MSSPTDLTQLQRTLLLLYRMQASDTKAMEEEILDSMKRAWVIAIGEKAQQYGCKKPANAPRASDLSELKGYASEDAQSIAQTWNKDVETQIRRLYDQNPRANRYYYMDNMEAWARDRSVWKDRQIATNTQQRARAFAQDRFRQENGLRGKLYRYVGPPPVSDICRRRMGWGAVTEDVARSNPTPAHPGPCVHEWQEVIDEKLICSELWVG